MVNLHARDTPHRYVVYPLATTEKWGPPFVLPGGGLGLHFNGYDRDTIVLLRTGLKPVIFILRFPTRGQERAGSRLSNAQTTCASPTSSRTALSAASKS